jgi:hypothetical protein
VSRPPTTTEISAHLAQCRRAGSARSAPMMQLLMLDQPAGGLIVEGFDAVLALGGQPAQVGARGDAELRRGALHGAA